MNQALGLIETIGYSAAMAAVDAAVKTAQVEFLGFETVIGAGKKVSLTVKLSGSVADVQAAVEAGRAAAERMGEVFASRVIPRPHEELDRIIFTRETKESLCGLSPKQDTPSGTTGKKPAGRGTRSGAKETGNK